MNSYRYGPSSTTMIRAWAGIYIMTSDTVMYSPQFRRWFGLPLVRKLGVVFNLNNNNNNILWYLTTTDKCGVLVKIKMSLSPSNLLWLVIFSWSPCDTVPPLSLSKFTMERILQFWSVSKTMTVHNWAARIMRNVCYSTFTRESSHLIAVLRCLYDSANLLVNRFKVLATHNYKIRSREKTLH